MSVLLGPQAEKDLRRIAARTRHRIAERLDALGVGDANADVKQIVGHPHWWRLRVGDWRALYRHEGGHIAVARIVNRRDLNKVVRSL